MKELEGLYTSVVIVAGGRGSRMNLSVNKQYADICGRPMLAWTVNAFEDCPYIKDIIIVTGSEDIVNCKQNIVDMFGFEKVRTITAGGAERQNSVLNGLRELNTDCDIVLVHDGARPFVNSQIIGEAIRGAAEFGAVSAAVPVKDTIKTADSGQYVLETLDRSMLWAIQTPQAFKVPVLLRAHESAEKDRFLGTDDAVLVERLGVRLKLITGSYENIKITTREDLVTAEAIAASRL